MATKMSHILKQICSFQLQVYLSMCDVLVDIRHYKIKKARDKSNQYTDVKVGMCVKWEYFQICCFHNLFVKGYIPPSLEYVPALRGKLQDEFSRGDKNSVRYNDCPQKVSAT